MKRMVGYLIVAVVASSLFSGCASIATAKRFNGLDLTVEKTTPVSHINAKVSGLYLLNRIPVLTGDTEGGSLFLFHKDTASLDNCVNYLTIRAKAEGATKVTDMTSRYGETWIGPGGFFVCWWRSAAVSANAVK